MLDCDSKVILEMRSVTKFFPDSKYKKRPLSQSIQKTLILPEFPVKILHMCTDSEAQRWKFDWNIVFSAYTNFQSKKNLQKCCIFIYIRCNITLSIWKLLPDSNPRGSKWPPNFLNLKKNTGIAGFGFNLGLN